MAAANAIWQSRSLVNMSMPCFSSLLKNKTKKKKSAFNPLQFDIEFSQYHNHSWKKLVLVDSYNGSRRAAAGIFTISATAIEDSSAAQTAVDSSSPPPVLHNDTITKSSAQWSEFAKNVSGEWDGYGADFSPEGKPFELPESVVPEAYREWEVKVFDWQTQCPTLAEPDDLVAKYKLIKLLPTVGCEADAATQYSVDERKIGVDNNMVAFSYQSSGSYVAVWHAEDHEKYSLLELEYCLVNPQNRESRVRIIQVVQVESCNFVIKTIKVFVEQWYGPFRNGEQLGGCSIRDTAFASTEALKGSEVSGVWEGLNAIAIFQNSPDKIRQQVFEENAQKLVRDGSNLILLPKKLWCSLKEREDGETHCEVGWLFDHGHALTSKCIFSSNVHLKEIATAHETADLV